MSPGLAHHRIVNGYVRHTEFLGQLTQCGAVAIKSAYFSDIIGGQLGVAVILSGGTLTSGDGCACSQSVVMHSAESTCAVFAVASIDRAELRQPLWPPHTAI